MSSLNVKFAYKRGMAGDLMCVCIAMPLATHGFHSSLFTSNKAHRKKIDSAMCHSSTVASYHFCELYLCEEELLSLPEVVEAMKTHF